MTLFWRLIAVLCLALGGIGLVLPVLPTVPFVLLAAWAASRGWPRLEQRLLNHPLYGPIILRWRERQAIPRVAKWAATLGMGLSSVLLAVSPAPGWLQAAVIGLMLAVAIWIWRRPEN